MLVDLWGNNAVYLTEMLTYMYHNKVFQWSHNCTDYYMHTNADMRKVV